MITTSSSSSSTSLFLGTHINNSSSCSKASIIFKTTNIMHAPCITSANTICCCSSNNSHGYVPKVQPFSARTKFDRVLQDPPLIQKSENELADYCSTLEGENSYSCWQAYFELKDLENKEPKDEVEKVILQAGGMKSLIGCLHGISAIHKAKKEEVSEPNQTSVNSKKQVENHCPVPDGLPRSAEEMEEEEKARMPDSSFTRLLRNKGRFPACVADS
ncbi:CCG-binding protein 1 isoform X2 [Apium graveolens]|uniref:CCG-binding protein 1 isoform X2 n=1 Tax=Apium graveolens TaxID=4045 RepID=UPI003D7B3083